MSAVTHPPLEDLEHGLKRLCRSQLMAAPEFKDMYLAIERHTRDVKLAHLTGQAKDLQSKTGRDTKFYTILALMLCEVQEGSTEDQKDRLKQVHNWYMANRHVLFCGPRFGKDHFKDEAKEFQHKAVMSRHPDIGTSPKEQHQSQKVASNPVMTIVSEIEDEPVRCQEEPTSPADSPREPDRAQELVFPSNDGESESYSATNSPDLEELDLELQSDLGLQSGLSESGLLLNQDQASMEDFGHTSVESSSPSSPRILLRPQVDTPDTFSPLKEQVHELRCLPESVTNIRNMVHPISSLVNPHAAIAKVLSKETPGLQAPVMSGKPSRSESFQAWQTFKKHKSYEQEVISKLNFLGRSGTAIDVRYSAHGHGENPEVYTQDFLEHFARHAKTLMKEQNLEKNVYASKTLQEFYETVENISPSSWTTFKSSLSAKFRSASSTNQNGRKTGQDLSSKKSKPAPDFCYRLEHFLANWFGQTEETPSESDTGVNLDTMINLIDSVTDNMSCCKEKLAPEPQLGFRQPSATELAIHRDSSSSSSFDVTVDYGCPTPSLIHQNENEASRLFSSPLTSSPIINKDMPDGLRKAKIRCISAGIVDWRGKIQSDAVQYKWPKTIFGGHTYLKKCHRPNLRSAGSTSAGSRPKTAPMATKEKWKTQRPSDKNIRAIQAASHSTTIVDQEDVESMMQVQHLLPHQNRSGLLGSFKFNDFQAEGKKHRKVKSDPQVTEYLSFIAPSGTVVVEPEPERYSHSQNQVEENTQAVRSSCSEICDLPHEDVCITDQDYDEDALNVAIGEDVWSLAREYSQQSAAIERSNKEIQKKHSSVYENQLKSDRFLYGGCRPDNMAAKVQRSAGRMPGHLSSTSARTQAFSRLQNDTLRRVSPIRTPASIPTSRMPSSAFNTRSGQIFLELEHHARKTKNATEFMNKVEGLRRTESSQHPTLVRDCREDSVIGTSLQICRHPVSSRGRSSQVLPESHHLSTKTESITSGEHRNGTTASTESRTEIAASAEHIPALDPAKDLLNHRSTCSAGSTSKLTGGRGMLDVPTTPSARSVSKTGRPTAQVFQTRDPDELSQAVKIQNEAAAAVDIQRIFRGFVARNVYKSLLSEERQEREEARKAAVRIQRIYRSHVRRKQAIYNRSHLNPELAQWSKDVSEIQAGNSAKRQARLTSMTSEMSSKHRETRTKLAVIGPHVEVYSAYHPKITGPNKHELNAAAVTIQKLVKGWLLRRKMKKLAKKAIWYGSSFPKLTHDYKAMLKRVQQQHGVDKPKTPFNIKDFNLYIDLRRRYENVFEKRSFGGELEHGALEAFFKECDLYPSRTEIEEAMDVTTHGQASRRDKKGVTKKELLDMVFYIYVPEATGLHDTRRSTWMSPIIDGQEARQMLGSEFVEPAPLAPCIKLVIEAKRAQRQREQAQREADQRSRIVEAEKRIEEDKQADRKSKKVMFQKTLTKDS